MDTKRSDEKVIGLIYGLGAFLTWGLLPIYWKTLSHVPAGEILANRIFWSFIFLFGVVIGTGKYEIFKTALTNKKNIKSLAICSILITGNWFTFIWAVNSNYVIETSMGYYIMPLVSVVLAITILKERISIFQYIALGMALIGVLVMTMQYDRVPWIALTLAFTFGLYGLAKKVLNVEPLIGLALETGLVAPVAFIYLVMKFFQGSSALGVDSIFVNLLLIGAGIATATPLLWFAESAKRLELSTLGFMEYIAPTITLLLGIFLFNENFTQTHLMGFTLIWMALIIYSFSNAKWFKKSRTWVRDGSS